MQLEVRKYLSDIERAARLLVEFTAGTRFDDYEKNDLMRAAVERQFTIMGEAVACLRKLDETIAGRISEHRRIVAFRIILIHGYADVDHHLVWDIVVSKIPTLRREIAALLATE
jgi:uncharacterized protein with HEPN domain